MPGLMRKCWCLPSAKNQGLLPFGKGQAAIGLMMVWAMGAAGAVAGLATAFLDGACFVAAFLAGAFSGVASTVSATFVTVAAVAAVASSASGLAAGVSATVSAASFLAGAFLTVDDFLAGSFFSVTTFSAAGFFAVAIFFSSIMLLKALYAGRVKWLSGIAIVEIIISSVAPLFDEACASIPRKCAARLVFNHASFKKVAFFFQVDHFAHPREGVFFVREQRF